LVNRIQNLRKDKGLEVTDRIVLHLEKNNATEQAFANYKDYICSETLAQLKVVEKLSNNGSEIIELIDGITVKLALRKE
jgi:isoleucyl-tRNA synthetase